MAVLEKLVAELDAGSTPSPMPVEKKAAEGEQKAEEAAKKTAEKEQREKEAAEKAAEEERSAKEAAEKAAEEERRAMEAAKAAGLRRLAAAAEPWAVAPSGAAAGDGDDSDDWGLRLEEEAMQREQEDRVLAAQAARLRLEAELAARRASWRRGDGRAPLPEV